MVKISIWIFPGWQASLFSVSTVHMVVARADVECDYVSGRQGHDEIHVNEYM